MIRKPHWRISIRALDFERSSHTQNRKRMIFSLRRVILCLSEYCSPRIDLKIYSIFIYNIIFIICIIHYHFYYQFSNLIPSFFLTLNWLIELLIDRFIWITMKLWGMKFQIQKENRGWERERERDQFEWKKEKTLFIQKRFFLKNFEPN